MPKKEKGKSHSTRPVSKRPPSWLNYQPEEVEILVTNLAKEGYPPSQIGTILRDQHAIPLVKPITGKKITQILKEAERATPIPEDLGNLITKASKIIKHLEKNKKDIHNKRGLQIVEAKIYKITKYYKREGILDQKWKYEPERSFIT